MGDFNPANGLIRVAHETVTGIPDESGWVDHEFVSEDVSPEYGVIISQSISNNSETPTSQPSKINSGGNINLELDPEGHYHYIANLMKHAETPVNVTGSVYSHKLAPTETDVDFAPSLSVEISRDDDAPSINKGSRVSNVDINIEPENFVTATVGVIVERSEYYEAATQTAATSTPTAPILRGLPRYEDWILADGNVLVQVEDASNAPTSIDIVVRVGAGAFATDTPLTVPAATWTELFTSAATPVRLGTRDIPVQIYWANFTNITNADTWRFDRERAVWVPVYPDVPKFNEIFASIYIDGTEYEIDQVALSIARPVSNKHAIGGRHAKRVKERGRRTSGGTLTREYLSTDLRKKLERYREFALQIEMYSGEAITGSHEHYLKIIAKNCRYGTSKVATITGNDEMNEAYPFTCHPSSDPTYPSSVTIELQNTVADLSA